MPVSTRITWIIFFRNPDEKPLQWDDYHHYFTEGPLLSFIFQWSWLNHFPIIMVFHKSVIHYRAFCKPKTIRLVRFKIDGRGRDLKKGLAASLASWWIIEACCWQLHDVQKMIVPRWFNSWPFDPLVGGHQQPLKGSLNLPKKVTKNCQVVDFQNQTSANERCLLFSAFPAQNHELTLYFGAIPPTRAWILVGIWKNHGIEFGSKKSHP